MERNYDCLLKSEFTYRSLILSIRDEVRRRARTMSAFQDSESGRIQIVLTPLSELAEVWLGGGLSDFGETQTPKVSTHDACIRRFTFGIFPEGGLGSIGFTDVNDATVWLDGREFLAVRVCVSGNGYIDEVNSQCSLVGLLAVQQFFERAAQDIETQGYFCGGNRIPGLVLEFKMIPDFVSVQES